MKSKENVIGTMPNRPLTQESNGSSVYGRRNIRREEIEDKERGEKSLVWIYDECILSRDEYESVISGRLPGSIETWTPFLRWFERAAILNSADALIAEANNRIELDDDPQGKYKAYKTALLQYKDAVRATVDSPAFPDVAEYPDLPALE